MKRCSEFPDKRRYNTKKEAETVLLILGRKDLKIYYCGTCSGWHLAKKEK